METIIGTDEAGYGPNYGPLVVAATCWEIDDTQLDLREALQDAVCQLAVDSADRRIEIADSKALYASGKSLGRLERGLACFCSQLFEIPDRFSSLFELLSNKQRLPTQDQMLFSTGQDAFPCQVATEQVQQDSMLLKTAMIASGVRLKAIRVKCVFPQEFNSLLECHGNKATLLSIETLSMVKQLLPEHGSIKILCDKHGGRSKYAGLIQHCLTSDFVKIHNESLLNSCYSWQHQEQDCHVQFMAKGESHLPIALASMAAKYVRERFMAAWNRFWLAQVPGLKPTAGYPTDARRFRLAISRKQAELGITESRVWRSR